MAAPGQWLSMRSENRKRSWALSVLTLSQRPTRGQPTEIRGRGATAGLGPDLPLGCLWPFGASPGEGLARHFQRRSMEERDWQQGPGYITISGDSRCVPAEWRVGLTVLCYCK